MMFVDRLLDQTGDYLKTKENVKNYLQKLPDREIKALYENIEFTPFSLMLAKEFKRRFGENTPHFENLEEKYERIRQ